MDPHAEEGSRRFRVIRTGVWIEYRDGFGSSTGNDNYWLGLEKIYRLLQYGNVRLRIEVIKQFL